MKERVPVTVLSGFLGSGKTTLLNRLLADPAGLRIAVVVNEFGEIGIDGQRVSGAQQFVELDNGCLCCALNEDLKRTLFDLRDRGGFDHLVLETTGLADPLPVAWTFTRPGLDDFYRIDALVTVVDAVNLARVVDDVPEVALQIERADILVLNKMDLIEDGGTAAVSILRAHNPRAPIVESVRGRVPVEAILVTGEEIRSRPIPSAGGQVGHEPSFETYAFETDRTLDDEALEDLLDQLPPNVYRAKGIVRTNADTPWTLFNAVAGRFEMEPFGRVPASGRSALVWIGKNLDRDELRRRCEALLIEPTGTAAP